MPWVNGPKSYLAVLQLGSQHVHVVNGPEGHSKRCAGRGSQSVVPITHAIQRAGGSPGKKNGSQGIVSFTQEAEDE